MSSKIEKYPIGYSKRWFDMKVYAVISSAKYDGSYFDDLEFICSTYERAQEICQSMKTDDVMLDTKYRVEEHEVVE